MVAGGKSGVVTGDNESEGVRTEKCGSVGISPIVLLFLDLGFCVRKGGDSRVSLITGVTPYSSLSLQ